VNTLGRILLGVVTLAAGIIAAVIIYREEWKRYWLGAEQAINDDEGEGP
jgi:hypothetical protein